MRSMHFRKLLFEQYEIEGRQSRSKAKSAPRQFRCLIVAKESREISLQYRKSRDFCLKISQDLNPSDRMLDFLIRSVTVVSPLNPPAHKCTFWLTLNSWTGPLLPSKQAKAAYR